MVTEQRDADPDLVDVGAEALGARLLELGPVPRDPNMDLLRELARSVLEAAADEEREAGMVAERGLMSAEFPHLPQQLVQAAVSEWYYPRPVPDAPMPERLRRVLRSVDQERLSAVLTPDTQAVMHDGSDVPIRVDNVGDSDRWEDPRDVHGGADVVRHPNEQPGRRMSPGQRSLVAAAFEDMAGWCGSHAEAVGGFEAAGIGDVVTEIERRAKQGHVGPAVARWLLEHGQDDPGPSLQETDPKLIGALVELAQEYGLRGVARTAVLMLARGDEALAPADPPAVDRGIGCWPPAGEPVPRAGFADDGDGPS